MIPYNNNSDKYSDCESETDLSPSGATSDDSAFEVKVKLKEAVSEAEYFEIPIQRTVATHKYCCICFSMENLTVIPEEVRIQSYIKMKMFIPPGNRCCTYNSYSKKSNIRGVVTGRTHLFIVGNDRKNRSTNLHQVLLQSRQELCGDD